MTTKKEKHLHWAAQHTQNESKRNLLIKARSLNESLVIRTKWNIISATQHTDGRVMREQWWSNYCPKLKKNKIDKCSSKKKRKKNYPGLKLKLIKHQQHLWCVCGAAWNTTPGVFLTRGVSHGGSMCSRENSKFAWQPTSFCMYSN